MQDGREMFSGEHGVLISNCWISRTAFQGNGTTMVQSRTGVVFQGNPNVGVISVQPLHSMKLVHMGE